MSKKLLTLSLAAIFLAAVGGCGGADVAEPKAKDTGTTLKSLPPPGSPGGESPKKSTGTPNVQ